MKEKIKGSMYVSKKHQASAEKKMEKAEKERPYYFLLEHFSLFLKPCNLFRHCSPSVYTKGNIRTKITNSNSYSILHIYEKATTLNNMTIK